MHYLELPLTMFIERFDEHHRRLGVKNEETFSEVKTHHGHRAHAINESKR